MTKIEYLNKIRQILGSKRTPEAERSIEYYSEMIDDLIEDGMTVEEATAKIGTPEEIADLILNGSNDSKQDDTVESSTVSGHKVKRKFKPWQTLLIILTSPIWLSILLTVIIIAFCIAITAIVLYIVLWSVIISLYAAILGLAVSSIAALCAAVIFTATGQFHSALFTLGAALVLAGITIPSFIGMNKLTILVLKLSGRIIGIRKSRREAK